MVATKGRFVDRCVVVLGGNAGIGLAAARLFAAEGAKVAITGRNADTIAAAAEEIEGLGIQADMGVVAQTQAAFAEVKEHLGGIDVLFVNAGVGGFAPVADVTEDFWDGIHNVNLRGAFFAIQHALPLMRDGGSIVITGSIGSVAAVPGNVAYAAAKAGLVGASKSLAQELASRNVTVNCVAPGFIRTAMTDVLPDAQKEALNGRIPMGRMGEGEDIGAAVAYLASKEAGYVTGQTLHVNGGMAMFA